MKISDVLDRETFILEYYKKNKSMEKIGEKYGFHKRSIERYKRILGLPRKVQSEINNQFLTQEQKEILCGSIMGHAHINCYGSVEIVRPDKQYPYIYWLYNKCLSISSKVGLLPVSNKYKFRTKSLEFLKHLRKSLYPNKIKVVNEDFLEMLTPLSLSVWFCDDGALDGSNYILYTRFSKNDNDLISHYMSRKWGVNCTVKKWWDKKYKKSRFDLVMNKKNALLFTDIIKYHLIPTMLYKLLNSEKEHIVYLAGGMQASPDGGIKWRRNIKYILNQRGYYCIDPTKEENCLLLDGNWRDLISTDFVAWQKNMRTIIGNDLYFVETSGIIVCLYDDFIGGGSFHEIGHSYLLNKKVYLLNLNKTPLKEVNWWALGCCTKVVNSIDELIDCLPDISYRNSYQHYSVSKR